MFVPHKQNVYAARKKCMCCKKNFLRHLHCGAYILSAHTIFCLTDIFLSAHTNIVQILQHTAYVSYDTYVVSSVLSMILTKTTLNRQLLKRYGSYEKRHVNGTTRMQVGTVVWILLVKKQTKSSISLPQSKYMHQAIVFCVHHLLV